MSALPLRCTAVWLFAEIVTIVNAHQILRHDVKAARDRSFKHSSVGSLAINEVNQSALLEAAAVSREANHQALLESSSIGHQTSLQAPERQSLPSTNIFDRINGFADDVAMGRGELQLARSPLMDSVKSGLSTMLFGIIFFLIAIPIQWFNEERSAKMETLLSRGLEECMSIDSNDVNSANRGKLVHVQGRSRGAVPAVDPQFQDALVRHCLKLQSTVEVFEWVQTTRTWLEGKEKRSQPRFHTEWTTTHHDSLRFRKPSPDNPRLPSGISLGTFTTVCKRVELGGFRLTDEMVNLFRKFEPAMKQLPPTVTTHGLTFFANQEDGYYYTRPSLSSANPGVKGFKDHQVGDLRVRFMCVSECDATVVAVQCKKDGVETFVPYRTIPRAPCLTDQQERQKLIEEGDRPLKDLRREIACCSGGVATCCCCPCNTIACCCTSEVITEEIFYVSDQLDPVEKPFQWVVQRNPCRVWNFRLIGWGIMYIGIGMILGPMSDYLHEAPGLKGYGRAATLVLAAIITLSASALIVASAYVCYRPMMSLKWLCVILIIILIPLLWGSVGHRAFS